MVRRASISDKQIRQALKDCGGNKAVAARSLGMSRSTLRSRLGCMNIKIDIPPPKGKPDTTQTKEKNRWIVESDRFTTPDEALAYFEVDTDIWEIERIVINGWDVTAKVNSVPTKTKDGKRWDKTLRTVQNKQIKIWLRRKVAQSGESSINRLLKKLEKKSPIIPSMSRRKYPKPMPRRAFEACVPDPHYGMKAYKPGADTNQSPESMAAMMLDVNNDLLIKSKPYGPFEQIILPLGNDFYHSDNVFNTTTAGTGQPEAETFLHTFITGEELAIEIVKRYTKIAPVVVYMIPGNHDRTASFSLGRVLKAYFHRDKNVTVHADESPYKFHQFGVNLIGYEHGHSVKPTIRLAALMANECPDEWAATKHGYREWHLGDQHRKGSAKPSVMEEQGVSVEFLPGICAPNEWHRLKSYNWQKRGAMGFVWDYKEGPIARVQVNIDRYLNTLMGKG